jgi:hypothetical protein
VRRNYHLDRGYERIELKLRAVGADIRRVEDSPDNMPASLRLEDWLEKDRDAVEQPPHFLSHRRRSDRWQQASNDKTCHDAG